MKEFKAVKEDLGLDELGKLFAPLSPPWTSTDRTQDSPHLTHQNTKPDTIEGAHSDDIYI